MVAPGGLGGLAPPAGKFDEIGIEAGDIIRATFLAVPLGADVAVGTGGMRDQRAPLAHHVREIGVAGTCASVVTIRCRVLSSAHYVVPGRPRSRFSRRAGAWSVDWLEGAGAAVYARR